jgi:hypothetical protein
VATIAERFYASPDAGISERDIRHDGEVTPARDVNASRLSFPLTLVLIIGSTVAGIVGTYEALSARLAVQEQQIQALTDKNEVLIRRAALYEVRVDETRVIIAEIKGFMAATGMQELKK